MPLLLEQDTLAIRQRDVRDPDLLAAERSGLPHGQLLMPVPPAARMVEVEGFFDIHYRRGCNAGGSSDSGGGIEAGGIGSSSSVAYAARICSARIACSDVSAGASTAGASASEP